MKITLIADIHGNLPALRAVLHHAETQGAAGLIINLGDSVGYGSFPEEIVQMIQEPRFINILGNYDKKVLSKKHQKNEWADVKNKDKREMFVWTSNALSETSRDYLRALPKERRLEFEGMIFHLTHGSPDSRREAIGPETSQERLTALARLSGADVILCGHSHQPFAKQIHGTWFINPGSVGRPDDGDPRASYAILDLDDENLSVAHFRVRYDILLAVAELIGFSPVFAEMLHRGLNYDDTLRQMEAE